MVVEYVNSHCPMMETDLSLYWKKLSDHARMVIPLYWTLRRVASFDWPVSLPANLPSCERCTFAWTWINAVGNREFYMNCADIKITGGNGSGIKGESLYLVNLPGYPEYQPPAHDGPPSSSDTKTFPVTVI